MRHAAGSAPCNRTDGMPPAGGRPDRSHGSLAFTTALHGLRALARPGPRGTLDRSAFHHFHGGARDPPDLRAVFPVTSRSLRPDDGNHRVSSLGVVQRSPLHRHRPESPLPGACAPFGEGCHTLPRSVLVVSHHRDGLLLSDCAGLFHPAADPGVRRVSSGRETGIPTGAILPFEAFPPATVRSVSPPPLPSRPLRSAFAEPGPQGLPPSSGPLCATPFPARRTRCSHGLGWFIVSTILRRIPRPR
jgi:hypothetical protein